MSLKTLGWSLLALVISLAAVVGAHARNGVLVGGALIVLAFCVRGVVRDDER